MDDSVLLIVGILIGAFGAIALDYMFELIFKEKTIENNKKKDMEIKIMSTENPDKVSCRFDSKDFISCHNTTTDNVDSYNLSVKSLFNGKEIEITKEQYISLNKQLNVARGGVVKGEGIINSRGECKIPETDFDYKKITVDLDEMRKDFYKTALSETYQEITELLLEKKELIKELNSNTAITNPISGLINIARKMSINGSILVITKRLQELGEKKSKIIKELNELKNN